MRIPLREIALLFLFLLACPSAGKGQNNRYTERSFVPTPSVRAMGDAGVALGGVSRPFFYNPAHLPRISSYFTILGVQAGASLNFRRQIQFFNRRIKPAIESNFDLEEDALEQLYREAHKRGRHPLRGSGAIILPSFVYSWEHLGVGGGLFAKTALNYRTNRGGVGVPEVFFLSRTDVMALLSVGADLEMIGIPNVSLGLTATRTRRLLAFEEKPLDTFTSDESAALLQGNTAQVDVGGLYTPSWWPFRGTFLVGGAIYDLLGSEYDYSFEGSPRIPFLEGLFGGGETVGAARQEQIVRRAGRQFRLRRSYRIGLAYRISPFSTFDGVGLALDYQGYGHDQQHFLARLHLGGRVRLNETFVFRSGLSAGYPTVGFGIRLGPVSLDYALHAFEDGRVAGQHGTYVHAARMTVRVQ